MDEQEHQRWPAEHLGSLDFNEDDALSATEAEHLLWRYTSPGIDDFPAFENLSIPDLLKLGFTRAAIEKHLSFTRASRHDSADTDHDDQLIHYAPDNNHKTPARYYSVEEVKKAMATPEVKAWLVRTKERRAKLDKGKQAVISEALGVSIRVDGEFPSDSEKARASLYSLMTRAAKNWNNQNMEGIEAGKVRKADIHSPDPVMKRQVAVITVRHIRDYMSNYRDMFRAFKNRPALDDTQQILRVKTVAEITQLYPPLSAAAKYVFFHPEGWGPERIGKLKI